MNLDKEKLQNKKEGAADETREVFEFDCPECGAHIVGEPTRCPSCGAEFIIEEAEEFECPECGELIPVDSTVCPKCGAEFEIIITGEITAEKPVKEYEVEEGAEEESSEVKAMRTEFTRLVQEIEPLITVADRHDIEITDVRNLMDTAAKAAKENEMATAVEYLKESKSKILDAINMRLADDIKRLRELSEAAASINADTSWIEGAIDHVKNLMDDGQYEKALSDMKEGIRKAEAVAGKYIEARNLLERLARLVENAERFFFDVDEAKKLLEEARNAGEKGDWSMMGILARKGTEQLLKTLPENIKDEMVRAKSFIVEAKAAGKEVSTLVRILKEAGTLWKNGKYDETLEKLIEFKAEARNLQ